MNNIEDIKKEVDGFSGNNPVKTNSDVTQQKRSDNDANLPSDEDQNVNDTSIPFEINGDDEIQHGVLERKYPHNDSFNKSDNSIYPHKEDIVPKKDRIPPEIRDDDNPADVDI